MTESGKLYPVITYETARSTRRPADYSVPEAPPPRREAGMRAKPSLHAHRSCYVPVRTVTRFLITSSKRSGKGKAASGSPMTAAIAETLKLLLPILASANVNVHFTWDVMYNFRDIWPFT